MQGARREDVLREVQALRDRAKRRDRPREVLKMTAAVAAGAALMWLVLTLIG